jgi:hypothetical protein
MAAEWGARRCGDLRLKSILFDFEKAMANSATGLPRLKFCIRLRNNALDGAEIWMPAANVLTPTTA